MRWFQSYCWVKTLDPVNVRFVDEVHFEPKSVRRRGGYAPRGHRIISIRDEWIKERYSMILLTDPEGQGYPFAAQLFAILSTLRSSSSFFFSALFPEI